MSRKVATLALIALLTSNVVRAGELSVQNRTCSLSEIVSYVRSPMSQTSLGRELNCNLDESAERGNAASKEIQSEQYFVKRENLFGLCVVSFDNLIQTTRLKTTYPYNGKYSIYGHTEDEYKYYYYSLKVQDHLGQQTDVLYVAFSEIPFDQVMFALDVLFGGTGLRAQKKIKNESLMEVQSMPQCTN